MANSSAPPAQPAFRVLVVVSRPLDQDELPNIADQWALVNGLATVKAAAYLHILRPPTIERLRNEILNGYEVVHFDGHGSFALKCPNPKCAALNTPASRKCERCSASLEQERPHGYLAFEKKKGGTQDTQAAEELARMLRAVPGSPTRLVFLSACESAAGGEKSLAATLLQGGIPAVLGMKESVTVDVTIALSQAFYAGLATAMTIAEAFQYALPALSDLPDSRKTGTRAQDIPVLQGKGIEARLVNSPVRGTLILEREPLFKFPQFDFVGEYIPGDPPRGRKGLLAQTTDALLQDEKLVALTGQGGIGKSVLAAAAARRISWRYPGGVFWCSAAGKEDFGLDELLDAFAVPGVFGYEFRTLKPDAKQDAVLGRLSNLQTPSLLILDNAEIIKDDALWRFLEGLPQPSAALVTTREAPKREWRQIRIPQMEPQEARRLFVTEARRSSPELLPGWDEKLNDAEMDALNEITRLLDGHPLGIKLAAGLLFSDSLDSIRKRLRASPPGEEIHNRFDFSYNTLSASQMELLARVAAFAGSYAGWAAEIVSGAKLFEEDTVEPLEHWQEDHSELVRKSFIDVLELRGLDENENEVTARRYRLHPLMRQYAAAKAGPAREAHRRRAAHLFLGFAESIQDYNLLELEHDSILTGADWAYAAHEWEPVKRYAWAIDSYLDTRGYWKDRKRLLDQALKATQELGDKRGMAITLAQTALLEEKEGHFGKALELIRRAERAFLELGSPMALQAKRDRERLEKRQGKSRFGGLFK